MTSTFLAPWFLATAAAKAPNGPLPWIRQRAGWIQHSALDAHVVQERAPAVGANGRPAVALGRRLHRSGRVQVVQRRKHIAALFENLAVGRRQMLCDPGRVLNDVAVAITILVLTSVAMFTYLRARISLDCSCRGCQPEACAGALKALPPASAPPSTSRSAAVMKSASADARKTTAAAMSSGTPGRPTRLRTLRLGGT